MAKKNFKDYINGEQPVLVDFFATWCGPCKAMTPILKDLAVSLGDDVKILKVDIDKNQTVAQKFKVRGVPTLILFKEGQIIWQQSGAMSKHQLEQVIKSKL
jgi:thioredoxin 1